MLVLTVCGLLMSMPVNTNSDTNGQKLHTVPLNVLYTLYCLLAEFMLLLLSAHLRKQILSKEYASVLLRIHYCWTQLLSCLSNWLQSHYCYWLLCFVYYLTYLVAKSYTDYSRITNSTLYIALFRHKADYHGYTKDHIHWRYWYTP